MLLQFRFENFKSFKDETILDLSATRITEHSDRVIEIGNEKILPVASIYGANASGKSNVLEAFRFMVTYVLDSFSYGGESTQKKGQTRALKQLPFQFDSKSKNAESLFEVYFIDDEHSQKTYNYGFTIDADGVVEEWLNTKSKSGRQYKPVFYRNIKENTCDLGGISERNSENLKIALERETLIVSLGAKLKINKLKIVRDWFSLVEFANFGNPIENVVLSTQIPEGFAESKEVQDKVVSYLASFDPSIIGFNVEELKSDSEGKKYIRIDALHRMTNGEIASIPLEEESDGTLKMFALYPVLHNTIENGGILLVDELNARLHPLLVRTFMLTFLNPELNKKHAQLIFTTHDAWQLANNSLRRDEVWFTDKNQQGISTLYSLADFVDEDGEKIRKDENFEKNYLLGKYGAIPSMHFFDVLKGE